MSEFRDGKRLARERLLHRYDSALAQGNFNEVVAILAEAEDDPDLTQMILAHNNAAADSTDPAIHTHTAGSSALLTPNGRRPPLPRLSLQPDTQQTAQPQRGSLLSGALSVAQAVLLLALFVWFILLNEAQPAISPAEPLATVATLEPSPTDVPQSPAPSQPPPATPTQTAPSFPTLTLEPVGPVVAFPGPVHYEGDMLSVVVTLEQYVEQQEGSVTLTLDDGDPFEVVGLWQADRLIIPFDTTGLIGEHRLHISAQTDELAVDQGYDLVVQPASQRPRQESEGQWLSRDVPCCTLHYISHTAAARDIDQIAAHVQQAADDFSALTGVDVAAVLHIYLIDRMWGTGAFSGAGEVILSYTDRNYGPARDMQSIEVIVRNGLSYAVGLNPQLFRYRMGLAVYLAGGHYKPEPIPERAAALSQIRGTAWAPEIQTLRDAATIAYIVERFGWEALWRYVEADSGDTVSTPEKTSAAMQQVFNISLETLEQDRDAWLRQLDPGEQVIDLQLSLELQNLRRQYQAQYIAQPDYLLGNAAETYTQPAAIPVMIREPRQPANVAVELMLANAQQALIDGRYEEVEVLIEALEAVIPGGQFRHPLAAEYLTIVQMLDQQGVEVLSLTLTNDEAIAEVTTDAPTVETLVLDR